MNDLKENEVDPFIRHAWSVSVGKYGQRQTTLPVAQKKHWLQIHKVKEVQHWALIIQTYICAVSDLEQVHHCPALQTGGGYAHLPPAVHPKRSLSAWHGKRGSEGMGRPCGSVFIHVRPQALPALVQSSFYCCWSPRVKLKQLPILFFCDRHQEYLSLLKDA